MNRPSTPQNSGNHSFYSAGIKSSEQISLYLKKLSSNSVDRNDAILFLSQQRDNYQELGQLLWETPGAVTALLTEVFSIYPHVISIASSPAYVPSPLTQKASYRVCNSISLFQSMAICESSRNSLISSNILMYLFPFLHSTNPSRECELLKLASLGVIGNLVKSDSNEVVQYLFKNGYVPLCLRILKFGIDINRILAAYILKRLITNPVGSSLIYSSKDNLITVLKVFNTILIDLSKNFHLHLSNNIILSYEAIMNSTEASIVPSLIPIDQFKSLQFSSTCDEKYRSYIGFLIEAATQSK